MRWKPALLILPVLLVAGQARAAGGSSGRGDVGDKGGLGPGSAPSSSQGMSETMSSSGAIGPSEDEDMGPEARKKSPKVWQVEGIWETHFLTTRSDLGGDAANKTVNAGFVYGRYDFTHSDRLWLRIGLYQRFLADDTESGFRADDPVLGYTHLFLIPWSLNLRLTGQASAPLSFDSQKMGLITELRLTASLDRDFGRFWVGIRTFGSAYVCKYSTWEGGNANPLAAWVQMANVEYRIPYLERLYVGADIANELSWYYMPTDSGNASSNAYGYTQNPTILGQSQPMQQGYGWEAYLRYQAPELAGVKLNFTAAYGQGDPTLGYTSALHDGVLHPEPLYWRHSSEVYFSLSAKY